MQMLINRGFYARQKNSGATFFTRAQIESWDPHSIAALLRRVPGMQVTDGPFARATLGRASGPASCPIQYFVDGIPVYNFGLWEMSLRDIEGVEVYRGASQVPAEFNRRTARCGVIVIWTRIS
jgi:outer membrane cobalamin receptor